MPSFDAFSLLPTTQTALANMHITEPSPVQVKAIPALHAGRDLVGQSATGSGKTLAYGIPLVERIAPKERVAQALVLVPTRELAVQVGAVLSQLATGRKITLALLVGGRPYSKQLSALRYGAQIVVGTPGRVKDHLDRASLTLNHLRMCVLDEADQMLDSGFAPAIEEILAGTPATRQMALFSATIPDWVTKLQQKFLNNPITVAITPDLDGQSTIEQIAYQVPQDQKMAVLCSLLQAAQGESSLIFGKTKYGVEKLGKQLGKLGFTVGTLHGNKSQRAREDVLTAFRSGRVRTLLATNVAARGLDIRGIFQVINYELPESSELFTHRVGRTGRMGDQGKAITLLAPSDLAQWRRMVRDLGQTIALQRFALDPNKVTPTAPETSVHPEKESKPLVPVQEPEQSHRTLKTRTRSRKPSDSTPTQEQDRKHKPTGRGIDPGQAQRSPAPVQEPNRKQKPAHHRQQPSPARKHSTPRFSTAESQPRPTRRRRASPAARRARRAVSVSRAGNR